MPAKLPQILINELVRLGKIGPEDVEILQSAALQENKEFGQVVVEKNLISDGELLTLKSEIYHLPVIDLKKTEPNKDALKAVSEDVAGFYKIIPFAQEGTVLKIGILNPEDIDALEAMKFIASDKGLTLDKYVVSYKDFDQAIKGFRTLTGEVGQALEDLPEAKETAEEEAIKFEEITAESPVTKVVGALLRHAVDSRASDIHVEPFDNRVRVRFRVDGNLLTTLTLPKKLHSAVVTRIKILSDLKIDETRLAQDGRFSTFFGRHKIDYRVSTFPTKNGEKVVMRILDPLANQVDLQQLGLQGRSLEILGKAMEEPFGSILITGPTGSGKSTTIAGMLKRMNNDEINIVTLEDPIEYFIDGVNQSQVHEEIGYTFASGLRHILRQDPDVIMVGEIRDRETAGLATQAALTGHVVLSTLHTNDAMGVIPRLIDMGVEKYLIPPTLNVAAAQRLMRRLCPTCKIKAKTNEAEEKIITEAINAMPKEYQEKYLSQDGYQIYKANEKSPCKECGGKAYKGRIGIFEMFEMTDELEDIILGTLSESAMREEAKRQGMITLFQDGILKVIEGLVSLEELLEVAQSGESA